MAQRTYPDRIRPEHRSWWSRVTGVARDAVLPAAARAGSTARDQCGPNRWISRVGVLLPRLLLIAAVALLVSAIGLFAFRAAYADKVYPAVAVGDVNVGGMTVDHAVATVQQRAEELERGTVTFTWQGRTWTPTLSELGATVDVDASVDAAWALGRDDNAVARLGFTNQLLRGDQRVPLRTTVDRGALHAWLQSVNADLADPAVNASLVVDGTTVSITPEHAGTIVDEDAATATILQSLRTLQPVTTELPTRVDVPDIHASDLEGSQARLAAALDGPIVASFGGQRWDIPPADLVRFLTVDVTYRDGGTAVDVTLDRGGLAGYLRDAFSGQVNSSPVDAKVAWSADQGGLVALEPSTDGYALRANAFADVVTESFLGDQSPVDIPVVVTKPAVDSNNLAALKINSRIARGDSNFEGGSEERDTNIYVGVDLLNGELVPPGGTFSFNSAVGEITADKGFVEAGVIEAETIGRDVGGGICQVSTTMFRAALLSGMPITEWWPHSLRLKGYERDGWTAGFDASILQAGSNPEYWGDFQFKNDSDGYILVQSWTDYPHVIVEIYGNDDGRTIDIGEPTFRVPDWKYKDKEVVDPEKPTGYMEQTQWPTEPYEAIVTRTVTYADGETEEQQFYSPYQGSGNVWVVSPDMKGKSPVADRTT
jgi:vancomycin resistance protein YoaR